MRVAISPTPLPLPDALALAQAMGMRPDLESSQRLAHSDWITASSAALLRRDRAGLEALLRAELAPAVAQATGLLGAAVMTASWWPDRDIEPWVVEVAQRLDAATLALHHAIEAVGVAERWEAQVDPERGGPTRPEAGASTGVIETAERYLRGGLGEEGARRAVHEDLARALCRLASPANALVTAVDEGRLDELLTVPLQEQLFRAYAAAGAALAYELALLGEGPLVDSKAMLDLE